MKTVEQVERDMGYRSGHARLNTSCCTYNPSATHDDPGQDCNQPARWHFRMHTDQDDDKAQGLMSCDAHRAKVLGTDYAEALRSYHEISSACGLEGSWWIEGEDGCGSTCLTEERGIELGILVYADQDRPGGDLAPS